MLEKFGWLFLLFATLWIIQLMLSLLQMKQFHRQYSLLRQDGDIASIGMSGNNWKRKIYGILVVDTHRTIVHAQQLSGFTVFARLKPVDKLVGLSLSELELPPETLDINKKLLAAFKNAAEFIRSHDRKNKLSGRIDTL